MVQITFPSFITGEVFSIRWHGIQNDWGSSPKEIFVFYKFLECEESSQVVKWLFDDSFIPWIIMDYLFKIETNMLRGPMVLSQGKTWRRRSIWRCQPFCRVLCSVQVWALYPIWNMNVSLVVQSCSCLFRDISP